MQFRTRKTARHPAKPYGQCGMTFVYHPAVTVPDAILQTLWPPFEADEKTGNDIHGGRPKKTVEAVLRADPVLECDEPEATPDPAEMDGFGDIVEPDGPPSSHPAFRDSPPPPKADDDAAAAVKEAGDRATAAIAEAEEKAAAAIKAAEDRADAAVASAKAAEEKAAKVVKDAKAAAEKGKPAGR